MTGITQGAGSWAKVPISIDPDADWDYLGLDTYDRGPVFPEQRSVQSQLAGLKTAIWLAETTAALPVPPDEEMRLPPWSGEPRRPASRRVTTRLERWRRERHVALGPRLPLLIALGLQAVLGVRLLKANTAFMDEALYLWAGRLELIHWLHGSPIPTSLQPFPTYFSGVPVAYPPLGALIDELGGLAAARLLSLIFMLGTTCLLYGTARRLLDEVTATAAVFMFALLGPTQFLSSFATYDPMALFLLALSSWLAVRAQGRASEALLALAGLVLVFSDMAKYAVALWDPIVFALVALTSGGGLTRSLFRATRFAAYTIGPAITLLLHVGGKPYIQGIMFTTVSRQAGGATATPLTVAAAALTWLWPILVLALIAIGISFTESRRVASLMLLLTGALVLAPLHQAQIHTIVSLQKHVVFGAWFGCIASGYALGRAAQGCEAKGWRIIVAAAVVIGFAGVIQADALSAGGWPNMSKVLSQLKDDQLGHDCPCLITANNVFEYYALGAFPPYDYGNIIGPFYFRYQDPLRGQVNVGIPAYVDAIHRHYFSMVEIDPAENPQLFAASQRALMTTSGYRLTGKFPIIHWPGKVIETWRYEPKPAHQHTDRRKSNERKRRKEIGNEKTGRI